jgi:hypothetical protein
VRTVTVAGRQFQLDQVNVEHALDGALPEPLREHFVVVGGRRWPPKQVLALATGLDRADFTTHQARRILSRLGFPAARTQPRAGDGGPRAPQPTSLSEALRPFIGQWVAVRDDQVLVAAASPREVVGWLAEHGQRAHSMFRVPDSERAVGGAAPL